LSPADQLILESIAKLNDRMNEMRRELNGRIDQVNGRIDNLWVTMLGGYEYSESDYVLFHGLQASAKR